MVWGGLGRCRPSDATNGSLNVNMTQEASAKPHSLEPLPGRVLHRYVFWAPAKISSSTHRTPSKGVQAYSHEEEKNTNVLRGYVTFNFIS